MTTVLVVDDQSLVRQAVVDILEATDELVASFAEAGLIVTTRVEGELARVGGAVDLVAYRVVQEGLTNALKHSSGGRAHLLVAVADAEVSVVVTNPVGARADGSGDEGDGDLDRRGGYGLLGLRERVAAVRGSVETGVTAGGFRLAAQLPLPLAVPPPPAPAAPADEGGAS